MPSSRFTTAQPLAECVGAFDFGLQVGSAITGVASFREVNFFGQTFNVGQCGRGRLHVVASKESRRICVRLHSLLVKMGWSLRLILFPL